MTKRRQHNNKGGRKNKPAVRTPIAKATGESNERHQHQGSKKKKKRVRGQKIKVRHVTHTGDLPDEKRLKGGHSRKLDVLRNNDEDTIPRKTRDMMASISRLSGNPPELQTLPKRDRPTSKTPLSSEYQKDIKPKTPALPSKKEGENAKNAVDEKSAPAKTPKLFDGMLPGENFVQFSARIKKQSRKMVLQAAKKASHQHEKKKAYYEKRKLGAERRKRKRRGELNESDLEEEVQKAWDDDDMDLNQLPSYWQDIVRNNGRPISEKKRRRLDRLDKQREQFAFGERVERPPEISVVPNRRGADKR